MQGVRVRVPASSANLGPGFDVLAVALDLWLELEVVPAREFSFVTELDVPTDGTNIAVEAFAQIGDPGHAAFTMRSEIPLSGGMGSSAAARVAGAFAALVMSGDEPREARHAALAIAADLEGHSDNASAAVLGGVSVELPDGPLTLAVPQRLAFVIAAPFEAVSTAEARAALPASVSMADATFNVGQTMALAAGLASRDLDLLARGLGDRLHQPHRAHLYPKSAQLLVDAKGFGALDATISGAGPTVLFWCERDQVAQVLQNVKEQTRGWANAFAVDPSERGAEAKLL